MRRSATTSRGSLKESRGGDELTKLAAVRDSGVIANASSSLPDGNTLALGRNVTSSLLSVHVMRMAAVFTLTTMTIARRTHIVSRWLTMAGLACAPALLAGIGISPWAELLFPAWILALSQDVLVAGPRALSAEGRSQE